ncbi:type 1 fimbria pilin [Sinobacterium caligoides]|uniref:Type 1 fimbria pilin n=1 Tax=Sinobacterium caligoides TaxID=933926 RepID=A0A3N2DN42_9GAMM|nr:fimbrial protein [Sinobacterium caligoides]ROS01069.1 type 1 fimbria pilin [Sinobacterium caligoides]
MKVLFFSSSFLRLWLLPLFFSLNVVSANAGLLTTATLSFRGGTETPTCAIDRDISIVIPVANLEDFPDANYSSDSVKFDIPVSCSSTEANLVAIHLAGQELNSSGLLRVTGAPSEEVGIEFLEDGNKIGINSDTAFKNTTDVTNFKVNLEARITSIKTVTEVGKVNAVAQIWAVYE